MRLILIAFFSFTCASSMAQVNFVLNPDFELYVQCPQTSTVDNISDVYYWSGVDSVGVGTCIPEYCNACATSIFWKVPLSNQYYQAAHSGNAYAHVQVYYHGPQTQGWLRDYLQGRLHSQLEAGKSYCVQFYVCLTEVSSFGIDRVGAYLDDGSIDTVSYCGIPLTEYIPQIQNSAGILEDTMNWVKIEASFTATGNEKFITIGNFYGYDSTNANAIPLNDFGNISDYSWYLIDDVSLIESDLEAYAGPDTWVAEGDSVFIGRTPEVGLDCQWIVSGNVIDSGAGIWVHPTATTTYVVAQTICGLTKTDTVVVEVWPTNTDDINSEAQVKLYPNPATNEMRIRLDKPIFGSVMIFNQLGQKVISIPLTARETVVDITQLFPGVYSMVLSGQNGRETRRFLKM